jgi:ribosome biogenesis GTPase A
MAIDWFPGHMLKARREVADGMGKVDVVIEVIDARVPFSSLSPMIEELRQKQQRPALKVLNKADLADPKRTKLWLQHYNAQPATKAVALSSKNPGEVKRIPEYCLALAPTRGTKEKQLRMMILGVPNVGKSSIMNALLKRAVAKVGNEPAVTKMQMRHELSPEMVLIDTPGMMWPGVDQVTAYKLAASHSIGRAAYSDEDVAIELGRYLLADYPELIARRYTAPPEGTHGQGLLEWIAKRRGMMLPGGLLNIEKASATLLDDFRSGALGRITLETPSQRITSA